MIRIEVGKTYTAKRARTGETNGSVWEMVVVESENGKEDMLLWIKNHGSGIMDGSQFRIKAIDTVVKRNVPYDESGKQIKNRSQKPSYWRTETTATVTIERVGFTEMPFDFEELPFTSNEELPFDMGDPLPL